jgi:hypothetical protein
VRSSGMRQRNTAGYSMRRAMRYSPGTRTRCPRDTPSLGLFHVCHAEQCSTLPNPSATGFPPPPEQCAEAMLVASRDAQPE